MVRVTGVLAVLLAAGFTVGCKKAKSHARAQSEPDDTKSSTTESVDGVSDDTIKIAQVAAFSGAQAGLGAEIYRGAMSYFLEVNSKGGINGRKIEIVPYDDKYSEEGGETAAQRAVGDDHNFVVFGATGTESMGGILKTLAKLDSKKYFLWGSTSGAESSREGPLAQYAFNIRGSLKGAGKDIVEAFSTVSIKKVGIVTQDDGFGKSAATAARKAAEDRGMQVVLELPISKKAKPDTTKADDIITKMRAAGADALILASTYNPSSVVVRDAREHGWNAPIATMGTPDTMLRFLLAHEKKTGKRMTNAVLGCVNVPPVNATDLPAVREYRDLLDRRNPQVPSQIADPNYRPLHYASSSLEGFVMAKVLGEALERAGKNLTRASLRKAAESIVGWDPGVGQRISFGPNDNQGFDSIWLPGVKNDEFTLITDMKRYLTDKPEPVNVAGKDEESKDKVAETGKPAAATAAKTSAAAGVATKK